VSANRLVQKRFDELSEVSKRLDVGATAEPGPYGGVSRYVNSELFRKWSVQAKDLISRICGVESIHYQAFIAAEKPVAMDSSHKIFKRVNSVFEAAKEDFQAGYLVSIRSLIQAEVFDTELEQAQEFLRLNYKVPAAVIAGTVLESAIRDLCSRNNIAHGKLDKMNADLAKVGVYNGIVQKRITHLAAVRNSAAHGNDAEFKTYDVKAMIDEVEQFLATHLT
jgi:hypothetical protein